VTWSPVVEERTLERFQNMKIKKLKWLTANEFVVDLRYVGETFGADISRHYYSHDTGELAGQFPMQVGCAFTCWAAVVALHMVVEG
jgi:hypothetical protein